MNPSNPIGRCKTCNPPCLLFWNDKNAKHYNKLYNSVISINLSWIRIKHMEEQVQNSGLTVKW